MAVITLTTDLGLKDYYVGAIKGAILRQHPTAQVVDISHDVPKFDIAQAAFMLQNVYRDFPDGTIHIIGVLPEADLINRHVVVVHERQYFVGNDNGIFSLLFDRPPDELYELTISQETDIMTFPTRDVFVKAACHLARGGTPQVIGRHKEAVLERAMFRPVVDASTIRGTVIYVDAYGNVITNISRRLFQEVGKGRHFAISFRVPGYDIHRISKTYSDVVESERLALFGASGNLEIAINIGHASDLLGLRLNDIVRIEFS